MSTSTAPPTEIHNLTGVLDTLVENTDGTDITLGDIMKTMNSRSYGPLLLVPALIALSPIGAIPGMSIFTGSIIIIMASQMVFNLSHPWLPQYLLSFKFAREKLCKGVETLKPWSQWIDRFFKKRIPFLTKTPFENLIAAICVGLAILFYPLALLPGAVALPSGAIVLFALGLTTRDGLLIVLGLLLTLACLVTAWMLWTGNFSA